MYSLLRPILFASDPEAAHERMLRLGVRLSKSPLAKKAIETLYRFEDPRLHTSVLGLDFKNPVGVAAGFDKNGLLVDFLPSLGFGFLEIGSVTARPAVGNPKPRLFRIPQDRALVNRMGLNNDGALAVYERLKNRKFSVPLGVNIAKTHDPGILGDRAIDDFCFSFKVLYELASFITLNISCPNTAEGKTFEEKSALRELLGALRKTEEGFHSKKPILLKLSPDLSTAELDGVLGVAQSFAIDGYVISNASSVREHMKTSAEHVLRIGKGGLSGAPLRKKSTELINYVWRHLNHPTIIGVGGVFSAEDAYEKICAGASLIEVYTGLIYEGPGLVKRIIKGISRLLLKDGFGSLTDAVGTHHGR